MKWFIFFALCCGITPYANEVANASRMTPGIGGEMLIPMFPIMGYVFYNNLTGENEND